jgi:hypothetical protein
VLHSAPFALPDLVGWVTASQPLAFGQSQTWSVSGAAITALPAVIEPDVSRSLALVPGVSFSSLVSARPMLRGLGADDVVTAIDDFPAINLYHAGRLFSSIPAVAVDHVDVQFQPASAEIGGTTAGEVNITGKSSPTPGGAAVQFGEGASSAAAGLASASGDASLFVAARTAKTSLIDQQLAENKLKYDFGDLYANAHGNLSGLPTQLSFFSSSDHLATDTMVAPNTTGHMNWSNLVIGMRSDLLHAAAGGVVGSLSYARHAEDGQDILSRGAALDVASRFVALTAQVDGQRSLSSTVIERLGFAATQHEVQNDVTPVDPQVVLKADRSEHPFEAAGYAALEFGTSRIRAVAGLRVDHAAGVTALQPRFSLRIARNGGGWIELAAGRSVRLFDLISDTQSETSDAYYDFWLPGGTGSTPLATMTNGSLEIARALGRWQLRGDLFGSSGAGVPDLKPFLADADSGQIFRFGQSRTYGAALSAIASAPNGRWSILLSYTYAVSERNWGDGWVPWIDDRRHQGRVFGTWQALPTVHLSTSVDVASPLPYTPITAWVVVPAEQAFSDLRPIYGAEMSGRGTALLRIDAALLKHFDGPAHSRWDAGIGISNLSWGDQSARTQSLFVSELGEPTLGVKTAFTFRAIPSIMIRGQIGAFH